MGSAGLQHTLSPTDDLVSRLPGLAADGFDQLGSRSFAGSGFLVHLHSLTVTMTQKSSVVQILNSVPQVLTSDTITKLLAGHSDVMLGYAVARAPAINEQMRIFAITTGMTPSPFDCWLAERGMLSFELRFDRAQATAVLLADHLATMPGVKRVLYPMRDDHPDQALASQLLGTSGCNMISFELEGGRSAANVFTQEAEGLNFAPTLGDLGTTLSHPASSSHRALTADKRASLGLSEEFFRVSVGLEDPEALLAVLTQAITAATS